MPVLDFLGTYLYALRKVLEARYRTTAKGRFNERMYQVTTTGDFGREKYRDPIRLAGTLYNVKSQKQGVTERTSR
jgi:predicted MarR family transcription regulator